MTEQPAKNESTAADQHVSVRLRVLVIGDSDDDAALLIPGLAPGGGRVECRRVGTADALRDALLAAEWDIVMSGQAAAGLSPGSALQVLNGSGRTIPFIIHAGTLIHRTGVAARGEGARNRIAAARFGGLLPDARKAPDAAATAACAKLLRLQDYDRATGLPGSVLFMRRAAQHLAAARAGEHVAVCLIDFARLARAGQAIGDTAVDRLLGQIARRLRGGAGETLVSRIDGARFVLLRGGFATLHEVQAFAQQMIDRLAGWLSSGTLRLQLASSMGISVAPEDGVAPDELMRHAETAMHHCRQLLGRNGFLFYFKGMEQDAGRGTVFGNARVKLQLTYHPVIALQSGAVIAMEALACWQHPELGTISEEHLAALVADPGAAGRAGEWALQEACRHAAAWHAHGCTGLGLTVNISGTRFRQSALPARLSRILGETRIDPHCVILEVAESALMRDVEAGLHMLHLIKRTGVRIAIGGFGIGCSSLGYLKRYPVDLLKIDRSFVAGIAGDARDAAIARAIIEIGRSLGLSVFAEGVETAAQAACLRDYGCGSAQGPFFGAPITHSDVPGFVACRPVDNSGPALLR